jgi:hypothetical protein
MSAPVIKSIPVTVSMNICYCDTCINTELQQSGPFNVTSNPPQVPYICPTCKKTFISPLLPGPVFTRS